MKTVPRDWQPPTKRAPKPGAVPKGKVAVYDHNLNRRGHMGKSGSAVTAARFGVRNATLQKVRGAPAWVGSAPGKPQASVMPLSKSLKAAKGSNR
jgi:hypothetical protein